MAGKQLQAVLHVFRSYILQQNWSLSEEREIQNGVQLLVTDGITSITVDCYTNGNALIQGPAGALKTDLQNWWKQRKASPASPLFEEADLSATVKTIVEAFRAFAVAQGWSPAGRMIHNGIYQLRLTNGDVTVPINVYPTGTVLIQGNPNEIRSVVERWWQQRSQPPLVSLWEQPSPSADESLEQTPLPSSSPSQQEKVIVAHIGTDEAGKGDYFGPLVIAGVYVDEQTASHLLTAGVRDSKLLPDTLILSLAEDIKAICQGKGHILSYSPERYNQVYKEISNLNLLLARAHAQVIAHLQKRTASTYALVDQFGDASLVPTMLQKVGCDIDLEQRTHGEEDVAVAAASIVARAEFVKQIANLSKLVGISLPKGTSNPDIVAVGREIVARAGQETLGKVAKLHFKTTSVILQQAHL
jgi:ribonuclease HIII